MSHTTHDDQRFTMLDGRVLSATAEIRQAMDGDDVDHLFENLEEQARGFWVWEGSVTFVGPGWAGSEPIEPEVYAGGEFHRGTLDEWIALHPKAPDGHEVLSWKCARHGPWPPPVWIRDVVAWNGFDWRIRHRGDAWPEDELGGSTHWIRLPPTPTAEWPPSAPLSNVGAAIDVLMHRTPEAALKAGLMLPRNISVDLTREHEVTLSVVGYVTDTGTEPRTCEDVATFRRPGASPAGYQVLGQLYAGPEEGDNQIDHHAHDDVDTTVSPYAEGVACSCGGYARRAPCTESELAEHGCGRDRPGAECCARAFVCVLCGHRYACSTEAPEMECS